MLKIRNLCIVLAMLLCSAASADVQVNIGINVPVFPELVVVPGYPVYYAPQLEENYFFYDGMYWVYQDDNWYASSWYNGPWEFVGPEVVPVYVLRIPVRYYRRPPAFFVGWRADRPPRWGDHWGHDWQERRSGWNRWDRHAAPPPAPMPVYQRQYSGDRYPQQVEQQHELQQQNYHYRTREAIARHQQQLAPRAPTLQEKQGVPDDRGSKQNSPVNPRIQPLQHGNLQQENHRHPETQNPGQPLQPEQGNREQQSLTPQDHMERQQNRDSTRAPQHGQRQERSQERNQ